MTSTLLDFEYKEIKLKEFLLERQFNEIDLCLSNSDINDKTMSRIIYAEIIPKNNKEFRQLLPLILLTYNSSRILENDDTRLITRIERVYEDLGNKYVSIDSCPNIPDLLVNKLNIDTYNLSELSDNRANLLYVIGGLVKIAVSLDERLLGKYDSKIRIKNFGKLEYSIDNLKILAKDVNDWDYFGFEGYKGESVNASQVIKV